VKWLSSILTGLISVLGLLGMAQRASTAGNMQRCLKMRSNYHRERAFLYRITVGKWLSNTVQKIEVQGVVDNEVVLPNGSRCAFKSNTLEHHYSRHEAVSSLKRHYEARISRCQKALEFLTAEYNSIKEN
jgi:hypothetical protein